MRARASVHSNTWRLLCNNAGLYVITHDRRYSVSLSSVAILQYFNVMRQTTVCAVLQAYTMPFIAIYIHMPNYEHFNYPRTRAQTIACNCVYDLLFNLVNARAQCRCVCALGLEMHTSTF